MKKFLLYAVAAMMAFTSCTDSEEVDVKYGVKLVYDPSSVISGFNGFVYGGELCGLDMYEGSELGIFSFVYDENGDLLTRIAGTVSDYTKKANYTMNMANADRYTVVTFAYAVMDYEGETLAAYSISNTDRLSKLTIEQLISTSFYSNFSVLGMDITTVDSSTGVVNIDLKPVTAMVEMGFRNCHAYDADGVDNLFIAYGSNDKVTFSGISPLYSKSGDASYDHTYSLDLTENEGNNIGGIVNILPTANTNYWAAGKVGDTRKFEIASNSNINIQAGHTYVIECDFSANTIVAEDVSNQAVSLAKTSAVNNGKVSALDLYNAIQK